jgi:16S rRNA (cytidine1402-2'-O)-methyltransferase
MSTLFVVATPIGNLKDISLRALEVLREVDFILCEDTRITQKLLNHYGIKTPTISYHQHSRLKKIESIVHLLREGKNLALVSDAGTPGISDPGNKLVSEVMQRCNDVTISPIPGPSAMIAAASIAGLSMDRFLFMGFPPHKKKRKKFLEEVMSSKYSVIFYESPYRIIKTLTELKMMNKELKVIVARELTKKFETIYRGTLEEVSEFLKKQEIKGEFVVIVGK